MSGALGLAVLLKMALEKKMKSIYKSYYHVSFDVSPLFAMLHDSLRTFGHPFLELWRLFDLVVNRLERLVSFESL